MKKGIVAVTAVVVLTISGLALAQMDKGKDMMGDKGRGMMGGGMMKGDMMDKGGMMGGKMMGMMGMSSMMQSMMQKQIVATSDGGIIVAVGNKFTKYDKDLNIVKEVELKMDMDGMHKQMMDMMQNCPMMGKGMMGDMKEDASKDAAAGKPASADEHASHHPENK